MDFIASAAALLTQLATSSRGTGLKAGGGVRSNKQLLPSKAGIASGGPLSCPGKKGGKEPAREGEDSESLPPPWTLPPFKRPKGVIPLLEIPEEPCLVVSHR